MLGPHFCIVSVWRDELLAAVRRHMQNRDLGLSQASDIAWFTLTMSTGGLALLLSATPHRVPGLTIIGKMFFILDLFFYVSLVAGISALFVTNLRRRQP